MEISAPPFISTFCSTSNGNILPFFTCRGGEKKNPDFTWKSGFLLLFAFLQSGTTRNRTGDTRIFSPLLYQLSYGTIPISEACSVLSWCKGNHFFLFRKHPTQKNPFFLIFCPDTPLCSSPSKVPGRSVAKATVYRSNREHYPAGQTPQAQISRSRHRIVQPRRDSPITTSGPPLRPAAVRCVGNGVKEATCLMPHSGREQHAAFSTATAKRIGLMEGIGRNKTAFYNNRCICKYPESYIRPAGTPRKANCVMSRLHCGSNRPKSKKISKQSRHRENTRYKS